LRTQKRGSSGSARTQHSSIRMLSTPGRVVMLTFTSLYRANSTAYSSQHILDAFRSRSRFPVADSPWTTYPQCLERDDLHRRTTEELHRRRAHYAILGSQLLVLLAFQDIQLREFQSSCILLRKLSVYRFQHPAIGTFWMPKLDDHQLL